MAIALRAHDLEVIELPDQVGKGDGAVAEPAEL